MFDDLFIAKLADPDVRKMVAVWPIVRHMGSRADAVRWSRLADVPFSAVMRLWPGLEATGICQPDGVVPEAVRMTIKAETLNTLRTGRASPRPARP